MNHEKMDYRNTCISHRSVDQYDYALVLVDGDSPSQADDSFKIPQTSTIRGGVVPSLDIFLFSNTHPEKLQ